MVWLRWMVLGTWQFLWVEVAGLDGVFTTSYSSYLCFVFIVVDLMCVFCVIVKAPPCMVVSFLLGSLSMFVNFSCISKSLSR